jgi:hypothetical protein
MAATKQTSAQKKAARSAAAKKAAETRRLNREAAHGGDVRASADRAWSALRDLGRAVRVEVEDRTQDVAPPAVVWTVAGVAAGVAAIWVIRA